LLGDDLPPLPQAPSALDSTVHFAKSETIETSIDGPALAGYRIVRELGRGGMGVVYLAHQASLNRLVAVKLVRAGVDADDPEVDRFRAEAQAVASLQHPNVVQVFEVDAHEGRPYFTQEYLGGGDLAGRINGTPWPAQKAADLVESLARAVQYAHERGIVHRDLKPANILFAGPDDLATPKITDFGIAKRLDSRSDRTKTGAIVGTPSYMAPEQAAGMSKEVGPRADVYALGAILYELLTGRPPFKAPTAMETVQQVVRDDPIPPARLVPRMPRDVETICLKCLEKSPARRYATASDLASDLERYLTDTPILARPAGVWHRTFKWCKRRPAVAALVLVSASAAIALAMIGSISHVRIKSALATAETNLSRAVAKVDRLAELADERLGLIPRMEHEQKIVLEEALASYEDFLRERSRDPVVRAGAAKVYRLLAGVELELGNAARAEKLAREGLALSQALVDEWPKNMEYQRNLLRSRNAVAHVLRETDRPDEARRLYQQALSIAQRTTAEEPDDPVNQDLLASANYNMGLVLQVVQDYEESAASHRDAIRHWTELTRRVPKNAEYQHDLGAAHQSLGAVLLDMQLLAESCEAYETALTCKRRVQEVDDDFAQLPAFRIETGRIHRMLGTIRQRQGDLAAAEASCREAFQWAESLARDYPRVPVFQAELATSCGSLSGVLEASGRQSEAQSLRRETLEHWMRIVERFPGSDQNLEHLAVSHDQIGQLHQQLGDAAKAEAHFRQAIAIYGELRRRLPLKQAFIAARVGVQARHSSALADLGRFDEAVQMREETLQIIQSLANEEPAYRVDYAQQLTDVANLLSQVGDHARAEELYAEGVAVMEGLAKESPEDARTLGNLAHTYHSYGLWLNHQGKLADAEAFVRKSRVLFQDQAQISRKDTAVRHNLAVASGNLADMLQLMGRAREAQAMIDRAIEEKRELVAEFPQVIEFRDGLGLSYMTRAQIEDELAGPQRAIAHIERAADIWEPLARDFPDKMEFQESLASSYNNIGWALHRLKRFAEAAEKYKRAIEIRGELIRRHSTLALSQNNHAGVLSNLASLLVEQNGDLDEAQKLFEQAVVHSQIALDSNPNHPEFRRYLRHHHFGLAELFLARGKHAEAASHAVKVSELYPADGSEALAAARLLCRGIRAAEEDRELDQDNRKAQVKAYGDLAMPILVRARELGSLTFKELLKAPELSALRTRDDLQRLLSGPGQP
jgi:serine/threonine protein kinase/tetratricopeptide (TPR) repeat protein